jgi:hypothetical protein
MWLIFAMNCAPTHRDLDREQMLALASGFFKIGAAAKWVGRVRANSEGHGLGGPFAIRQGQVHSQLLRRGDYQPSFFFRCHTLLLSLVY